jgi:predicted transcriptional regulator
MNKRKRHIVRWLRRNQGWHFGSMVASGAKVDLRHVFEHLDLLEAQGLVEAQPEPEPWPNQDKGAPRRTQYRLAEAARGESYQPEEEEG